MVRRPLAVQVEIFSVVFGFREKTATFAYPSHTLWVIVIAFSLAYKPGNVFIVSTTGSVLRVPVVAFCLHDDEEALKKIFYEKITYVLRLVNKMGNYNYRQKFYFTSLNGTFSVRE